MRFAGVGGLFLLLVGDAAAGGCGSDQTPMPTCETSATPDATFAAPFEVDTGPPSTVGAGYGQPACVDQYLVELDLTQADFQGFDVFVSARWSLGLPVSPCDERVTMGVKVFDGSAWQPWDDVVYTATLEGPVCHGGATSHTNAASADLDGTNIPTARGFTRARIAVRATRGADKLPILVLGDTQGHAP
jgi:hypothetical protein